MAREVIVRETIESHLAGWDAAYIQGDAYGYLGHRVPDETGEYDRNLRFYLSFMNMTEVLESKTIIQEFALEAAEARVTIRVDEKLVIRFHNVVRFKSFVTWLARFVFVSYEIRRLVWLETSEGWLCKSDDTVSSRVRVRRNG